MQIDRQLLDKYNQSGPRYTSYPPATFFKTDFDKNLFIEKVKSSNYHNDNTISLYIHIPFCKRLCHFCGCFSIGFPQEEIVNKYIDAVCSEIEHLSKYIDLNRVVKQIHWGGGTPHSIPMQQIHRIMDLIFKTFKIDENAEIAMECNPAYTDLAFFDELHKLRFNRISLGIQDFNEKILSIVNRETPAIPIDKTIDHLHKLGIGTNIDLIYGLPTQTLADFEFDLKKVIELNPHRLVTFSYAHVPWVKKSQMILEKYARPDAETKLQMLEMSNKLLHQAGYISIGMDHFAKPDDELAIAFANKKLHRNFQGYCTKETTGQIYAFGASGISSFTDSYFQNSKDISDYIKLIGEGKFATTKGYELDELDKLTSRVISELMCNMRLDANQIGKEFGISSDEVFNRLKVDKSKLQDFENDGMLNFEGNTITVNERGNFFIRNIAMVFDTKLGKTEATYSKTI